MHQRRTLIIAASFLLLSVQSYGCRAQAEDTKASVVSNKFAGKKTASGKRFNPQGLTAASKSLPLGSKAIVKNKRNGKQTEVTITDRGPNAKGRGIDLSKGAANKVGVSGVSNVQVKPVHK